ncbi:hypothetical protein LMG28727_07043 [Paraburkholderia kirstenboschensis]|nr:hypothetical protein LMG28727_07043 [Paraburkholderia kirstenboschensis]
MALPYFGYAVLFPCIRMSKPKVGDCQAGRPTLVATYSISRGQPTESSAIVDSDSETFKRHRSVGAASAWNAIFEVAIVTFQARLIHVDEDISYLRPD